MMMLKRMPKIELKDRIEKCQLHSRKTLLSSHGLRSNIHFRSVEYGRVQYVIPSSFAINEKLKYHPSLSVFVMQGLFIPFLK